MSLAIMLFELTILKKMRMLQDLLFAVISLAILGLAFKKFV